MKSSCMDHESLRASASSFDSVDATRKTTFQSLFRARRPDLPALPRARPEHRQDDSTPSPGSTRSGRERRRALGEQLRDPRESKS